MNCIFCKIINGDIPSYTVYEDDIVKAFLDINPSTNGEILLIPKKHFVNINDIPVDVLNHMSSVIKELYTLQKERLNCSGMTLIQNNDYGQEIKHFHIHLVPRYENDLLNHNYNKEMLIDIEEVFNKLNG